MPLDMRSVTSYDLRVFVGCEVIHGAYKYCPQEKDEPKSDSKLCARYERLEGWKPYIDAYIERRAQCL